MAQGKKVDVFLTRELVRKAPDMSPRVIEVPYWPDAEGNPGKLLVQPFNMGMRKTVRKSAEQPPRKDPDGKWQQDIDPEELEVETVMQGVRDPEDPSKPFFNRGDRDWLLGEKSSGAISFVAGQVMSASGMEGDAVGKPDAS